MARISLKQINWGPTIKLGLIRSWLSGIVLIILGLVLDDGSSDLTLGGIIMMWVLYPILALFIGGIFWLISFIPMAGLLTRIVWTLIFCLGDPIVYILNKTTDIFNKIELKFFNFELFLVVLKDDEE
jgi:hypothetical protein